MPVDHGSRADDLELERWSTPHARIPVYDQDLFTDEAIADPYPHYRRLREMGPVVWLASHEVYALPRYAEVRAALSDPETFSSGQGVAFNDQTNEATAGLDTLTSDGETHRRFRAVASRGLTPRALRSVQERIEQIADQLVAEALSQTEFDAVSELAERLPLTVVPELIGWEPGVSSKLLQWGGASFDSFGPVNERQERGLSLLAEMFGWAHQTMQDRAYAPDGIGQRMLAAVDAGEISAVECSTLLLDHVAPSLDTTISALGAALWLLAGHPEQWNLLRAQPDRIPNAFNEILRLQTPVRMFTRVTAASMDLEGFPIPRGARVAVMFASANRDERFWEEPDEFQVCRANAGNHLGFGYGLHGCLGQGLARLEGHALLEALVRRVHKIVLLGEPTLSPNNVLRSYSSLPVRLEGV